MSIHNSDPWFGRGQTLGVTDATAGTSVTGSQKVFSDTDPRTDKGGIFLSNRLVTCIAARNTSGAALLPGAVVKFKAAALLDEVDGPAATATGLIGVVDEYLPASGCPDKDVCWIVVSGPTAITTSATLAAGAAVTATAGKAAASAAAADIVGYSLSAPAGGKVRTIVGVAHGHSAF
jgi:hypothetical protein